MVKLYKNFLALTKAKASKIICKIYLKILIFRNKTVFGNSPILSRELSKIGWVIYSDFDWNIKKVIGDQFIRSTDSVGANIAEGYGRYHYLDKIKFYYNARASLKESRHWIELIKERNLSNEENIANYLKIYKEISPKLNGFINSCYRKKQNPNC